jgi:hypothetical protein
MEYRVVNRVLKDHDFYEGVRAVLIDKDKMPKWSPSRIDSVTKEMIDPYFAPFNNPQDELQLLSTLDYRFKSPRIGLFPTGFIIQAVHEQGSTLQEVLHELYASRAYYFSPFQEEHIRSVLSRKFYQLPNGRYIRGRNMKPLDMLPESDYSADSWEAMESSSGQGRPRKKPTQTTKSEL